MSNIIQSIKVWLKQCTAKKDQAVGAKQIINPESRSIKQQEEFISEGGNSQPMEKTITPSESSKAKE